MKTKAAKELIDKRIEEIKKSIGYERKWFFEHYKYRITMELDSLKSQITKIENLENELKELLEEK